MNCDRIARLYRWIEYAGFGNALERTRAAQWNGSSAFAGARRALVLGDGDGRALTRLLEAAPRVRADYVDLSRQMLELARARAGEDRVLYHCADALEFPLPPHEYDLIVTHFFLDCLSERDLARLIGRIKRAARPGARWIVSEFRDLGWISRAFIRGMYLFFRWTTGLKTSRLTDHRKYFSRDGFRLERIDLLWRGLLVSERWVLDS